MHLGGHGVDRHIAAGGVDHLDRVATRLAHLDQTAGGVVVLAAENGDPECPRGGHFAHGGRVVDVIAQVRLQPFFRRGDRDVVLQRLPSQEHPGRHGRAVGQRHFDGPGLACDFQPGFDHIAQFRLTVGGGHLAPVKDRGGAGDGHMIFARDGVHVEPDLGLGGGAEHFDVVSMQGRGARAGVDLGLEGRQAKLRQSHPFFPAEIQSVHRRALMVVEPAP
mmetsp:Transcript_24165/g.44948  ORF Transcript_24165/g.44948 Transcript_24165/m.44948 type:complete len:220 (+) Transcript_24165:1737-2396(+)